MESLKSQAGNRNETQRLNKMKSHAFPLARPPAPNSVSYWLKEVIFEGNWEITHKGNPALQRELKNGPESSC